MLNKDEEMLLHMLRQMLTYKEVEHDWETEPIWNPEVEVLGDWLEDRGEGKKKEALEWLVKNNMAPYGDEDEVGYWWYADEGPFFREAFPLFNHISPKLVKAIGYRIPSWGKNPGIAQYSKKFGSPEKAVLAFLVAWEKVHGE